eukprot:8455266-Pyramimonas_sp.AAC.1
MTGKLFDEYCAAMNMKFGQRRRATGHNAVLTLDNASSHTVPPLAKERAYQETRGFEMSDTIFVFRVENEDSTAHFKPPEIL